jgi:methylamine--corrinoid protein Co-methyltransferase
VDEVVTFWDVVERTSLGERMKESEFDAMLYQTVRALIEKYDIHFDGETAVPSDDGLADRAYQAALELFLATGFYCTSTQRAVRFTREEVEEAVRHAKTHYVFGEGRDQHVMGPRTVEDPDPPTCIFSHLGVPVKQDLFPKVCLAQAQEQYADAFCCVSLHDTFRGIPIKSGHPVEVAACMWDVTKRREAARLAGRPGLGLYALVSVGESTASIIAASHPAFGALPRDVPQVGAIAELKVDYERMNKVAFQRECGIGLAGLYGPLMGGYAGGPEGTMLVQIAHFFLGLLAFDAEYHICFPIDIHQTCSTTLPLLWLVSVYCQAIARNSRMLNICTTMAAGGPSTDMLFYEMVNGAIAHTVSGAHSVQGGIARDKNPEHISTLELRLGAETAHAITKMHMTRAQANSVVKEILARYVDDIPDAPLGKRFSELYDLDRVKPLDFYVDIYRQKKEEIAKLGIDYSLL